MLSYQARQLCWSQFYKSVMVNKDLSVNEEILSREQHIIVLPLIRYASGFNECAFKY